jgi:hypothetical protein
LRQQSRARCLAFVSERTMKVYGLMITKDDEAVFGDWCRDQLPL